jgi:hypothetical protein
MAEREAAERSALSKRQFTLSLNHVLPIELKAEFDANQAKLDDVATVIDPLFVTVRDALADGARRVEDHVNGLLPSQLLKSGLTDDEKELAVVYGILERDNLTNTKIPRTQINISVARGEYRQYRDLYLGVLPYLAHESAVIPLFPPAFAGYDLKLIPQGSPDPLPPEGNNLVVVADVNAILTFRVFDSDGGVTDTDETAPGMPTDKIADLKTQLKPLWPPHVLTSSEQSAVLVTVASILGLADVPHKVHDVRADQWASVVRILAGQSVGAKDDHLGLKTRIALGNVDGGGDNAPPSSIDIDLPDLEQQSDIEILRDNVLAMQGIYFASMMEELKVFQVIDKLLELFQQGMLPLGKGKAGDILYGYWKKSVNRLSETERRNLYSRAFGLPGGDAVQGSPNRDFNELWLRFIAAVSSFIRQVQVDDLLRARMPMAVTQELVRKAGRDLAANLSLHGYGMAYFAATELQTQLNEMITLLSDDEIKNSFGARDMWQVIDQVATLELGGARNSIRYRTMATSGAIIMRWLADKASLLASPSLVDILDMNEIRNPPPRGNVKATSKASDQDLVNACNQYLSVTGTSEDRVEQYSQPIEGPAMTSRPIQIPSVARDLLDSVGVRANGLVRT